MADDSRVISYLIFLSKNGKMGEMMQNLSSSAVVIGALRAKGPQNNHLNAFNDHL